VACSQQADGIRSKGSKVDCSRPVDKVAGVGLESDERMKQKQAGGKRSVKREA
jgi:hypothetical protein